MSLHIILGVADAKASSEPFPVYVGRSGNAAREAMLKSSAPRFLVIANPSFIAKNNPRAAANAASAAPVLAPEPAPALRRPPPRVKADAPSA